MPLNGEGLLYQILTVSNPFLNKTRGHFLTEDLTGILPVFDVILAKDILHKEYFRHE